jgi:hypothetical protein
MAMDKSAGVTILMDVAAKMTTHRRGHDYGRVHGPLTPETPMDFCLRGVLPDGEELGLELIAGAKVRVLTLRQSQPLPAPPVIECSTSLAPTPSLCFGGNSTGASTSASHMVLYIAETNYFSPMGRIREGSANPKQVSILYRQFVCNSPN